MEPSLDYSAISLLAFGFGAAGAWLDAAVLAIDGGNSKTDVALVGWDGTLLAAVRGPGASHEDYGIDGAMRRLGDLVAVRWPAKAGLGWRRPASSPRTSPRAWPAPTCRRRRRR